MLKRANYQASKHQSYSPSRAQGKSSHSAILVYPGLSWLASALVTYNAVGFFPHKTLSTPAVTGV